MSTEGTQSPVPSSHPQTDRQMQAQRHTLHRTMALEFISKPLIESCLCLHQLHCVFALGDGQRRRNMEQGEDGVPLLSGQRQPVEATFCICSFNKQILNCFCVPDTVLGASVINKVPGLEGYTFHEVRDNKHANKYRMYQMVTSLKT